MEKITSTDIQKAAERITATYPAQQVIAEVFNTEVAQANFIKALDELTARGATIKVGGRRVRELLGCSVLDVAEDVVDDALYIKKYREHGYLRLWPLLEILQAFPTDRMVQPDLDFFIWGILGVETAEILQSHGFETSINEATGKVWVVDVQGESGTATFVDGNQSWQTGESWPLFASTAAFNNDSTPSFDLDISAGRLYLYPLEIPAIDRKNSLAPQRVAAIGRALLWLVTASTPDKKRLHVPFPSSQLLFLETVAALPSLIKQIRQDPTLLSYYRSGLRDMAVTLRIILLTDWDQLSYHENLDPDYCKFLGEIQSAWQVSMWDLEN